MTKASIYSLIALNLLAMPGAIYAIFCGTRIDRIPQLLLPPSDFNERLSAKIGTPYTEKMHSGFIGLMNGNDKALKSLIHALHSYADLGICLGVISIGICLASLVILSRTLLKRRSAE